MIAVLFVCAVGRSFAPPPVRAFALSANSRLGKCRYRDDPDRTAESSPSPVVAPNHLVREELRTVIPIPREFPGCSSSVIQRRPPDDAAIFGGKRRADISPVCGVVSDHFSRNAMHSLCSGVQLPLPHQFRVPPRYDSRGRMAMPTAQFCRHSCL